MEKKNMLLSLVLLLFSVSMESANAITNCRIPVEDLPTSNPIYMSGTSPFYPNGTSGQLGLIQGQTLTITCPGSQLLSPHSSERPQTATIFCVDGNIVSSLDWLPYYNFTFTEISCACPQNVRYTWNTECRPGSNTVTVQLVADSHIYDLYSTCYSNATSMSEYAIYSINGYNYFTQTLASDPPYQQGRYSNYVIVDELYSPAGQEYSLEHYLGRQMVPQYLRPGNYLGRGELVHRKTFVFNTEQLSAFHYVNVVPIWQSVDNGNWISLQRSIKKKISQSGTRVQVHSGHWGNLALDDEVGTPTKIYLNSFQDELPVPLYVYKVIRDPDSFKATAFVIINNPHITEIQARGLVFCPNFCAGSTIFSWLDWEDDDVFKGYAFCCEVPEFLKTVTNLPPISSSGLFA